MRKLGGLRHYFVVSQNNYYLRTDEKITFEY